MALLRVSKCCCCLSLKYGFLTFAILSLLYRLSVALSLAYLGTNSISFSAMSDPYTPTGTNPSDIFSSFSSSTTYNTKTQTNTERATASANLTLGPFVGGFAGWYIVTAGILILAINGIFQKRSIYLYPYIVVLIIEIIVMVISCIVLAVVATPWILINLFLVGGINTYAIICLISLYHTFKEYERSRPSVTTVTYEGVPLKTV